MIRWMLVTSTLWWMVAKTVGIMVICGSTTHTNKNPTRPCIKRDLTPNCYQEGETFLGFPLSRKSKSSLQSISTFQQQFNFERILDQNFTYIISFWYKSWMTCQWRTNWEWSRKPCGKNTAYIPLFYLGTTNPNMVCALSAWWKSGWIILYLIST